MRDDIPYHPVIHHLLDSLVEVCPDDLADGIEQSPPFSGKFLEVGGNGRRFALHRFNQVRIKKGGAGKLDSRTSDWNTGRKHLPFPPGRVSCGSRDRIAAAVAALAGLPNRSLSLPFHRPTAGWGRCASFRRAIMSFWPACPARFSGGYNPDRTRCLGRKGRCVAGEGVWLVK